jgi:membrane protein DedA with SNARE-associated domain
VLILAVHFHFHFHFHLFHHRGAAIDYFGLAGAAFLSWLIWVGPGEPAMIAAGVVAARHRLDITPVVFWGWIGAMLGGIVGWLIGLKAGRAVLTAPGPLYRLRLRAVAQGERVFKRVHVLAIIASPPWVAGINRSRPRIYLPVNALSALVLWAAPLGIGAYYAGPPVLDLFGDMGTLLSVLLAVVVVTTVGAGLVSRRLRRRRREQALSDPPQAPPSGTGRQ